MIAQRISSICLKNGDSTTEIIDFCQKSTTAQRILSIFLKNGDSTTKNIDFLKNSKKNIRFFSISRRPKSDFDDPLSKNNDFGTRPEIPGIAGNRGESAETVAATAAPTPTNTRAGGQDDGSYTNSLKL